MSILTSKMAFDNDKSLSMPDAIPKPEVMSTHFKCNETGTIAALTSSNNNAAVMTVAGLEVGADTGTVNVPRFAGDILNPERITDITSAASMVMWGIFDTSQDRNTSGSNLDDQGMILTDDFGGIGFDTTDVIFKYWNGASVTGQTLALSVTRPETIVGVKSVMRAAILHPVSGGNRIVNCYDILLGDVAGSLIDRVAGGTVTAETTTITGAVLGFIGIGVSGWKIPVRSFGSMVFDGAIPSDMQSLLIDILDKAQDVAKPLSNGYRALG